MFLNYSFHDLKLIDRTRSKYQTIELVSKLNLKRIIFIGDEFYKFKKKFNKFVFYKNYIPVINYLNKEINNVKNIFVMGSRSNKLDRIIKQYAK